MARAAGKFSDFKTSFNLQHFCKHWHNATRDLALMIYSLYFKLTIILGSCASVTLEILSCNCPTRSSEIQDLIRKLELDLELEKEKEKTDELYIKKTYAENKNN